MSADVMAQAPLVRHFDLIAKAPGGVARLRELILTLAVQGKLVPQDSSDEPASELLKKIRAEKDRLITEGKIKRDKPLAEITGDELPFEVPINWEWTRLGTLLDRISNGYPGGQSKNPTNFPLTRIETISRSTVDFSRVGYCTDIEESDVQKYRLEVGDILLSHINSDLHLGKTALYTDDRLLIHGTNLLLLRSSAFVDSGFINLLINQLRLTGFFLIIAQHAIGQASINQSKITSILVALPPLAEQSRIVTRVEELMQLCDALEAQGQLEAEQHARLVSTLFGSVLQSDTPEALADNWQRIATHFDLLLDRPEAVDALEQTILQLAVRGLLVPQDPTDEPASVLLQKIRTEKDHLIAQGKIKRDKPLSPITDEEKPFELPQGWEWARLGDVGVTQTGGTPNKNNLEHFGSDIPFIKPGDIYPERVDYQNEGLSSLGAESLGRIAEAGSILMVCIGTIGKSNLIDRSCSFNQQINSVTPVLLVPEYLLAVLRSAYFQDEAWSRSSSTTISILNKGKWESIPIPVPPLQEQSRILSRFDDCQRFNRELKIMLTEAIELSRKISAAIVSVSAA